MAPEGAGGGTGGSVRASGRAKGVWHGAVTRCRSTGTAPLTERVVVARSLQHSLVREPCCVAGMPLFDSDFPLLKSHPPPQSKLHTLTHPDATCRTLTHPDTP